MLFGDVGAVGSSGVVGVGLNRYRDIDGCWLYLSPEGKFTSSSSLVTIIKYKVQAAPHSTAIVTASDYKQKKTNM